MQVNTVLMPVKAMQFNPLTQRQELMPTGYLQEYKGGVPQGQPIKQPVYAPVPQDRAITSSMHMPQHGVAKASFASPSGGSQEDYYRNYCLPNETREQTYMRNVANVGGMQQVPGTSRFVSGAQYGPGSDAG